LAASIEHFTPLRCLNPSLAPPALYSIFQSARTQLPVQPHFATPKDGSPSTKTCGKNMQSTHEANALLWHWSVPHQQNGAESLLL